MVEIVQQVKAIAIHKQQLWIVSDGHTTKNLQVTIVKSRDSVRKGIKDQSYVNILHP